MAKKTDKLPVRTASNDEALRDIGWPLVTDLAQEVDRIFDLGETASARADVPMPDTAQARGTWLPSVDLVERETAWVIACEVPGFTAETLDVAVTGDFVTLTGRRTARRGTAVSNETHGLSFVRAFRLPDDVDRAAVTAELRGDTLVVTLHKTTPKASSAREIDTRAA
jgi:HSP20 family protein